MLPLNWLGGKGEAAAFVLIELLNLWKMTGAPRALRWAGSMSLPSGMCANLQKVDGWHGTRETDVSHGTRDPTQQRWSDGAGLRVCCTWAVYTFGDMYADAKIRMGGRDYIYVYKICPLIYQYSHTHTHMHLNTYKHFIMQLCGSFLQKKPTVGSLPSDFCVYFV